MANNLINNFLKEELDLNRREIKDILTEFGEQSKVEKVQEESFVVNEIIKGTTIAEICKKLEEKHNEIKFYPEDIYRFLKRNRDIVKSLEGENTVLVKRHLSAVTKVEEEMEGLYLFTKELLRKYDKEGDNNATLGAINALNKTLVNFAKLKGYGAFAQKDTPQTQININIDDKRNAHSLEANFRMVDKEDDEKERLKNAKVVEANAKVS